MKREMIRFAALFAVLYAIVLIPWPGWREFYGNYFRALGNGMYAHRNGAWAAYFEPYLQTKGFETMDLQIVLYSNQQIQGDGNVRACFLGIDSRSIGWLPTGLTLALILPFPLPFSRRVIAALIGVAAIQLYVLGVIGIYLLNRMPDASITCFPDWFKSVTDALEWTFVTQIGPGFMVPVLIALGAIIMAGGPKVIHSIFR